MLRKTIQGDRETVRKILSLVGIEFPVSDLHLSWSTHSALIVSVTFPTQDPDAEATPAKDATHE